MRNKNFCNVAFASMLSTSTSKDTHHSSIRRARNLIEEARELCVCVLFTVDAHIYVNRNACCHCAMSGASSE